MKKGFTLLELVVVIVIIGILATLGLVQYTKVMEKSRTAEAKAALGLLRSLQTAYFQEKGGYATTIDPLVGSTGLPTSCPAASGATHYFSYAVISSGDGIATRCTGTTGKSPGYSPAYSITLSTIGSFSETGP